MWVIFFKLKNHSETLLKILYSKTKHIIPTGSWCSTFAFWQVRHDAIHTPPLVSSFLASRTFASSLDIFLWFQDEYLTCSCKTFSISPRHFLNHIVYNLSRGYIKLSLAQRNFSQFLIISTKNISLFYKKLCIPYLTFVSKN